MTRYPPTIATVCIFLLWHELKNILYFELINNIIIVDHSNDSHGSPAKEMNATDNEVSNSSYILYLVY